MAELNMEKIVSLVNAHGVHAFVQQTGGGMAAIYAGTTRTEGATGYFAVAVAVAVAVAAGPGWFSGARWSEARRDDADFYIGSDNDGSAPSEAYGSCNDMDETAVSAEIVKRALAT